MKKALAVLLTLTLFAFVLSACSNSPDGNNAGDTEPGSSDSGNSNSGNNSRYDPADYIYIAEQIQLPRDIGEVNNFAYSGGRIYFTATENEYGNAENEYVSLTDIGIYSMELDGTGLSRLSGYTMPSTPLMGAGGTVYISKMDIDADGNIWVAENWYFYKYNLPENFDYNSDELWKYSEVVETGNILRKLDSAGSELMRADIDYLKGQSDFLNVIALTAGAYGGDGTQYIFLGCADDRGQNLSVYVLDSLGNLQFRIDTESYFNEFIHMPGGALAFPTLPDYAHGSQMQQLQTIDVAGKGAGGITNLPDTFAMTVHNGSDDSSILISDTSGVYSYIFGEEEAMQIINWIESNIVIKQIEDIIALPDGCILCTNVDYRMSANAELYILSARPRSELPERVELTLATLYGLDPTVENAVAEFNATNIRYRIEVANYEKYNTAGDLIGGLNQLNTEINAGKMPDIICTNGLPLTTIAQRGLLADIYALIDADPAYIRSDFVESAFRAAEIDGVLYEVFYSFMIDTLIGNAEVVGPDMGWSADEFMAVLDAHPEADMPLGLLMGKTEFLIWALMSDIDEYIDWEAGTVNFDSSEFVTLLELADRTSPYTDWTQIPDDISSVHGETGVPSGRQILTRSPLFGFKSLRDYREKFGAEIAFKGVPTSGRNGNSINKIFGGFAIAEHSEHKDGAWEFVRVFLDRDRQVSEDELGIISFMGFPTNQEALDMVIEDALETGYANSFINGIPDPLPTQKDIDEIRADIDTILALIDASGMSSTQSLDEDLLNIIREDAAGFFNGTKTAEEAAHDIQGRAAIYISERS